MAEGDKVVDAPFEPKVTLPAEVAAYVRESYKKAELILEYGSGGSTVIAARETDARVISVESDKNWANNIKSFFELTLPERKGVEVVWENIGKTKAWGYPLNFRGWKNYKNYPLGVWRRDAKLNPDVVLIDGRFRKGCFAAVMLNCKKPTHVIFDDYAPREYYHEVEDFFPRKDLINRAGIFEISPREYSNAEFQTILSWFFEVR